jgi:AcrR family transcriptional regulator
MVLRAGTAPAPHPVRRPTRADARRNYDLLLQAAAEAFTTRGGDVPLEDVARAAGVAIGTLYRNFPARQDLVRAVYLHQLSELEAQLEALVEADLPAHEAFLTLLRLHLQFSTRGHCLAAGVLARQRHETLGPGDHCARVTAAAQTLLSRAQAAGTIREDARLADIMGITYGIALANVDARAAGAAASHRMLGLLADGLRPVSPGSAPAARTRTRA